MLLVKSEIAGSVWQVAAAEGDDVAEGDQLVILESMKMEIPVLAPSPGRVTKILVGDGDIVAEGDGLVELS